MIGIARGASGEQAAITRAKKGSAVEWRMGIRRSWRGERLEEDAARPSVRPPRSLMSPAPSRTLSARDLRQSDPGADDGPSARAGRDQEGGVHPERRWEARKVEDDGSPLRGVGDLPPQGIPRRSRPDLCLPDERVVRSGDAAL